MSILYPSDAELEILQILWEAQPLTVRQVHEQLALTKDVGYTTTLKQMQRMLDKELLSRTEEGKTHLYTTPVQRGNIRKSLLSRLAETAFKGSAMSLAMQALGDSDPSEQELEALERWLEEKRKQNPS
ncbi:MAG: BlaI/MecI/CopY family transcriptional regulator [Bacteroidia bacterium]|nr:BlaI/MecI/CopY family transcriptional regulator [Bacteroidia bacterium]